jgi:hypothetical protein
MDDNEKPQARPEDEPRFMVVHRHQPMYPDQMAASARKHRLKLVGIRDNDRRTICPEQ